MATWKKILTEADAQKDLVTGSGLSGGVNNVLIGADGDVTLAVDINGATDLGNGVASGDEILVADVNASNAIKKTTVGDIVNLASSGVSGNTFASDLKIGRDADNLIDFATADNEITFRANGSDVLELTNNSGDSILSLLTQDKNFQIKGNDGGAAVLALDIDMAAAGKATFVGEVVAPSLDIENDVDINGTLEADAITINGTAIASVLSPVAGNTSLVTTGALDAGSITSGFGNIDVGGSSIAAGSFDASNGNITNVGDIDADSISVADAANGLNIDFSGANTGTSALTIKDNVAEALVIQEGTNDYLQIVTTNSSEAVKIGHGVSGTAITIGHTTSEVTIGDNLTVTGDLTVSGTTTTINTTNLEVEDHIILLGTNGSPTPDTGTLSGIEVETSGTASKRSSIIWTKDLGASNDGTYDGAGTAVGLTGWACTNHQESNQASFPIAVMEFSTNSTAPTSNSAGVGCFHYDTGDDKLYIRTA
jgi:cytoskeletal protein CcmA (bactofilin family)